jgi:hypothetical protein
MSPEGRGRNGAWQTWFVEVQPLQRNDVIGIRHEYDEPTFRVDFWQQCEPPEGTPPELMGWKQDSYRLGGADGFEEVRQWAEAHAKGRPFVVYAELVPQRSSIVRIEGRDPTKPKQWERRRT